MSGTKWRMISRMQALLCWTVSLIVLITASTYYLRWFRKPNNPVAVSHKTETPHSDIPPAFHWLRFRLAVKLHRFRWKWLAFHLDGLTTQSDEGRPSNGSTQFASGNKNSDFFSRNLPKAIFFAFEGKFWGHNIGSH